MTHNHYYRTFFERTNMIKLTTLVFFYQIASYPRLVLEVFIRKNMGENYFNIVSALTAFCILFIIPIVTGMGGRTYEWYEAIPNNWTYYAFLAAFLVFSFKRKKELRRGLSKFDFSKFSLSAGDIHPFFSRFKIKGKEADGHQIEMLFEPAPFFIAGVILALMSQGLGLILIFCSVVYSASYYAAYYMGDRMMLNIIDKKICNEATEEFLVGNNDPAKMKGTRMYFTNRPTNEQFRKNIYDEIVVGGDGSGRTYAV